MKERRGVVPGRTTLPLGSWGCLYQTRLETKMARLTLVLHHSSALGLRRGMASPKEKGRERGTEGGGRMHPRPRVQQTWVQIPTPHFASYVALGQ